jgi:hypothetical protein
LTEHFLSPEITKLHKLHYLLIDMLLTNFPNYPFLWQNELELKHFSTTEKGQKVGTHPQSICILGQDMTKWVIFAEVTPFDRNLIPTELSITSTENITTPNTLILIIMSTLTK